MTLTDFLLARIAEDEDFGTAAGDGRGPRLLAEVAAKRRIVALHELMPWRLSGVGFVVGRDGRRWDQHYTGGCCGLCTAGGEYGGMVSETGSEDDYDYCGTLIALAAVYADHPDYDPSWRA